MPPIVPSTQEDLVKALIYSELSETNIPEYTRLCMSKYQNTDYSKRNKIFQKKKKHLALEEALLACSFSYEDTKSREEKRKINKKAIGLIRRCCKGNLMFVRGYYKLYQEMKAHQFYLEDQDESFEIPSF